jgi:hypothetical protein
LPEGSDCQILVSGTACTSCPMALPSSTPHSNSHNAIQNCNSPPVQCITFKTHTVAPHAPADGRIELMMIHVTAWATMSSSVSQHSTHIQSPCRNPTQITQDRHTHSPHSNQCHVPAQTQLISAQAAHCPTGSSAHTSQSQAFNESLAHLQTPRSSTQQCIPLLSCMQALSSMSHKVTHLIVHKKGAPSADPAH